MIDDEVAPHACYAAQENALMLQNGCIVAAASYVWARLAAVHACMAWEEAHQGAASWLGPYLRPSRCCSVCADLLVLLPGI